MKQFCEDVVKFLESEYNDSYRFEIKRWVAVPPKLVQNPERAELIITINPHYKLTIVHESMWYLFGWYRSGEFIEERHQYRWQKELIDMIEGG